MHKELPLKVQLVVFRNQGDNTEVLFLKRSPEDGGFWNTVVGTLELNESILECRSRELKEETGIVDVLSWSDEIYRFTFPKDDYQVAVLAYAAEVSIDQVINLNHEHTDYKWVKVSEAINQSEKLNVKECIRKFSLYYNLQ